MDFGLLYMFVLAVDLLDALFFKKKQTRMCVLCMGSLLLVQ